MADRGSLRWKKLCDFFERNSRQTKRNRKEESIAGLLKEHRSRAPKGADMGSHMYQLIRILLPQFDREEMGANVSYNMKELSLAQRFIEALSLNKKCEDAQRLLGWKQPIAGEGMGNFSLVLENVLRPRTESNEEGKMTLGDVNAFLDQLSENASNSKRQAILLAELLIRASAYEIRWIARVILRELKAGLSEKLVLNAFHPDAMEFFKINTNLREVVNKCKDPKVRLNKINIDYFQPFNPMLAEKVTDLQAVPEYFKNRVFWIENKFDGERIQIHKCFDRLSCYTRRGNDYTELYQPLLDILRREKLIAAERCILDGEVVGWNFDQQKWEKFGTNKSIAMRMGNDGDDWEKPRQMSSSDFANSGATKSTLCFVVFDIVCEGDTVMTDWPLKERRERLVEIIREKEKIVEIVKHVEASDSGEVYKKLEEALETEEEGIVLKNPESKYVPKSREKGEWMKLKPDYLGGSEEFDLLIVGGTYGKGQRGGQVWQFICAVADEPREKGKPPSCFRTMCRVGTGKTREEFMQLFNLLKENMRPYKRLTQGKTAVDRDVKFERKQDFTSVQWQQKDGADPVEVLFSGNAKEEVDVVFDPRKSRVLTLVADYRLIESNVFMAARGVEGKDDKTGWTLRFPRIREGGYRCGEMGGDEKPWFDCMTSRQFEEAIARSQQPYHIHEMQAFNKAKGGKKRKLSQSTGRRTRGARVIEDAAFSGNSYEAKYDVFKGMEICVLPGDPEQKRETEQLARELGATMVANIDSLTTHIIGMRMDQRFKNLKEADCDVIGRHWVSECSEKKRLVELAPRHMMHASAARRKEFHNLYDKFGDSFTERCTEKELDLLLDDPQDPKTWEDLFDVHSDGEIDDEEMKELEDSLATPYKSLNWSSLRGDRVLSLRSDDASNFARDWLEACKILWKSRGCVIEEKSVKDMQKDGRWMPSLRDYDVLLVDNEQLIKELQRQGVRARFLSPACDINLEGRE